MNVVNRSAEIYGTADLYRFLAHQYLLDSTQLDRIDRRMEEYTTPFLPCSENNWDYYRKHDYMFLKYIYNRNDVHLEQLDEQQLRLLEKCYDLLALHRESDPDSPEEYPAELREALEQAAELVSHTWRKVLSFADPALCAETELFPSIHGEGIVPSNAVVFCIATVPDYDDAGNIRDWDAENKRLNIVYSLKEQLEPLCEEALGVPVRFMIT
ncbi:MAG: hypothetical protein Q4B03_06330 [Lachnospiraceae bacterium]|nr:hypothetical protein [Lachnospiraceae bacterium]